MRPTFLLAFLFACRTPPLQDKGEIGLDTTSTGSSPDNDGDGWGANEDCDDADPATNPGATEVCDGVDNDCDGEIDEGLLETWYGDADGDGYGEAIVETCEPGTDLVAEGGDCDDADPAIHPGALELCDGIDNDCDELVDEEDPYSWYPDEDGDGYGDPEGEPIVDCQEVPGYSVEATDCDDADPTAFPGNPEDCDEVDNDCDGLVDEGMTSTWYGDGDGDGYGEDTSVIESCDWPEGTAAEGGDCDDADATVNPGAEELCDGVDNDCDGDVDEDAIDATTWYADADGDGYGDPASASVDCDAPTGGTTDATDCDDGAAAVNPGATEICDGVDDDCDGLVDDDDASLDSSTASAWYADVDGDGYGDDDTEMIACDAPSGAVSTGGDCDDGAGGVNPDATEICDGIDNDCDAAIDDADSDLDSSTASTWYADSDGDGYGDASSSSLACDQPSGTSSDSTDCDDGASGIHPGATEICDGEDNDCDGATDDADASLDTSTATTWYADDDADGFGDPATGATACTAPSGSVDDSTDCDDADGAINPDATEICDGIDNDCDALVDDDDPGLDTSTADGWWPDLDLDGYGDADAATTWACDQPSGYEDNDSDCDDGDSDVNPDVTEECNGIDDDCDGTADTASVCPCNVEYDGDYEHPYLFCESALNWADAETTCEDYGYTLLVVDDATEDAWADGVADTYSTDKWWFGYDDITLEGSWVWVDGSSSTYTNWGSSEPNDSGGNEDCAQLNRYTDGTWNDEPCSSTFYFVCEAGS